MTDEKLPECLRRLAEKCPLFFAVLAQLTPSASSIVAMSALQQAAERSPALRGVGRATLWAGLQQMEKLDFGSVMIGRRGAQTRIELVDLTVARLRRAIDSLSDKTDSSLLFEDPSLGNERSEEAVTEAPQIPKPEQNPRLNAVPPAISPVAEMVSYRLPLRAGVFAELVLPADLTTSEVDRIGLLLKAVVTS